MNPENGFPG